MVECLTQDLRAVVSSLTALCPSTLAKYWFKPGRPVPTQLKDCWLGRKESNQTKQTKSYRLLLKERICSLWCYYGSGPLMKIYIIWAVLRFYKGSGLLMKIP